MISYVRSFQVQKRNFGGNWYKQTNANDLDHMTSAVKGFIEKNTYAGHSRPWDPESLGTGYISIPQ